MDEAKAPRWRRILSAGVLAAGLAVLAVCFYFYQDGTAGFDEQRTANEAEIVALTQELVALTERTSTADGVDYAAVLSSAADAGRRVADAQNSYLTKDYLLDESVEDPMEVMRPYMGDGRKNTKWGSVPASLDGTPCVWEFDTIYEFGLEDIPVLWTCWSGEELMCSVTAVYHAGSGQFTDFTLYEMYASKPDPTVQAPVQENDVQFTD